MSIFTITAFVAYDNKRQLKLCCTCVNYINRLVCDVIQHLNTLLQSNPESIEWSLIKPTPGTNNGGQLEEPFCDLRADNLLQQYISCSTQKYGNKLDLVLCNCPEIIKNFSSIPPGQLCFPNDHHIIEFAVQQSFSHTKSVTCTIPSCTIHHRRLQTGKFWWAPQLLNTQSLWNYFI